MIEKDVGREDLEKGWQENWLHLAMGGCDRKHDEMRKVDVSRYERYAGLRRAHYEQR